MVKKLPDHQDMQKSNEELFMEQLRILDPQLYAIKYTLDQTKVNVRTLNKVMWQLFRISTDTKWGSVVIQIQDGIVKYINGISNEKIEEPIVSE